MSRYLLPVLTFLLPSIFCGALPSSSFAKNVIANEPGTHEETLESSSKEREYLLHIPKGYKKDQKELLPLVIMLHGRTSNGRAASSEYYGWKDLADKEKFIAVFPTALGSPTSWNGAWAGKPTEDSIFLAELIDVLLQELSIDKDRVYMTGHSSGGFMSFSFSATHSDKVAAIGPVAGLMSGKSKPKAPVSVISFHGMADNVVAYDKNSWGMLSAVDSAAFFAKHNGVTESKREDILDGKVHVDTWHSGRNDTEVVLYSIEGGDHGWPRGGADSVSATELIWAFFKSHPQKEGQSGPGDNRDR